jgi:restriction system protein
MALPKRTSVELPLLKVISDSGGQLPMDEAVQKVTLYFPEITPEDLASRLSSTGVNRWRNSVQWTRQQLVLNGELDGAVRGVWRITEKGRSRLEAEWSSWKPKYREELVAEPEEWMKDLDSEQESLKQLVQGKAEITPEEYLEDTLWNLNEAIENEVLVILSRIDPSLFESIIGQLLEKMGYGDVKVTGRSGDGGIDGTCSTDALGLYKLHFQAKRWKNQVGVMEIRNFIGAIQTAHHSEHGIFVTTSDFSKDAVETAEKSGKIRLVNGRDLAGLMVKYGLGVTKTRLDVAKIDRDYFEGL